MKTSLTLAVVHDQIVGCFYSTNFNPQIIAHIIMYKPWILPPQTVPYYGLVHYWGSIVSLKPGNKASVCVGGVILHWIPHKVKGRVSGYCILAHLYTQVVGRMKDVENSKLPQVISCSSSQEGSMTRLHAVYSNGNGVDAVVIQKTFDFPQNTGGRATHIQIYIQILKGVLHTFKSTFMHDCNSQMKTMAVAVSYTSHAHLFAQKFQEWCRGNLSRLHKGYLEEVPVYFFTNGSYDLKLVKNGYVGVLEESFHFLQLLHHQCTSTLTSEPLSSPQW